MKNTMSLVTACFISAAAIASSPELIVEKVPNGDFTQGNTYRLYAHVPSNDWSLHAIWGDQQHPLKIESTTPFFQHAMGSYSAVGQHETLLALDASLKYDSYITLGYSNHVSNSMWDIGISFEEFDNSGGAIATQNGAWFLLPQDIKCLPSSNHLILLGQFTLTGNASGVLNLQGLNEGGEVWKAYDLPFSTQNAFTFGCMNPESANYNQHATWDDGSCGVNELALSTTELQNNLDAWTIFPNPVRENLIHLQLEQTNNPVNKFLVEIWDMSGRKIASHDLSKGNWSAPGRITLNQALSPGNYTITLIRDDRTESKQLIVVK